MRSRVTVWLLIGWLAGMVTLYAAMSVSGGWYEYRLAQRGDNPFTLINEQGWELVEHQDSPTLDIWYLRRPRLHR